MPRGLHLSYSPLSRRLCGTGPARCPKVLLHLVRTPWDAASGWTSNRRSRGFLRIGAVHWTLCGPAYVALSPA